MFFASVSHLSSSAGTASEGPGRVRASGVKPSVLIVDDDEDVLFVLTDLFEGEGYAVRTANDGKQALDEIQRAVPDVIILDLMMPVMSGWDVWDRMQSSRELAGVPVVVFTANGLGPGAFGELVPVVRKGASVEVVLTAVDEAISGRRRS